MIRVEVRKRANQGDNFATIKYGLYIKLHDLLEYLEGEYDFCDLQEEFDDNTREIIIVAFIRKHTYSRNSKQED